MKICVTSQGTDLDAQVDPRFGRCAYFLIIDPDTMKFESIANPNITGVGGVGIQSGQFMTEKDVSAVLTGNVGPNAFQTLTAAGITIYTGNSGTIKNVLTQFKEKKLSAIGNPTAAPHSGQS